MAVKNVSAHLIASVYASAYTHAFFSTLQGDGQDAHGFVHKYSQRRVVVDPLKSTADAFVQAVNERYLDTAKEVFKSVADKDKNRFIQILKTKEIVVESRCSRPQQDFVVGALMDAMAKDGYEEVALVLLQAKPHENDVFYGRYLRAAVALQRIKIVQYICRTRPQAVRTQNPLDGCNALHCVMTEGMYFVSVPLYEKGQTMVEIARIVASACPLGVVQPNRMGETPLQELERYRAVDRSEEDPWRSKIKLLYLALSYEKSATPSSSFQRFVNSALFNPSILKNIFPFIAERRANANLILKICNIFREALMPPRCLDSSVERLTPALLTGTNVGDMLASLDSAQKRSLANVLRERTARESHPPSVEARALAVIAELSEPA